MTNLQHVYSPESQIEDAIDTVLTADGITVYTPLKDPVFQKKRPRVEAIVIAGPGRGILIPKTGSISVPGSAREQEWDGRLEFIIVTEADIMIHRCMIADVRYYAATMLDRINGVMKLHVLLSMRDSGSTPTYSPETGVYNTSLVYSINYRVLDGAWALVLPH